MHTACMRACVRVCVCVCERERDRQTDKQTESGFYFAQHRMSAECIDSEQTDCDC